MSQFTGHRQTTGAQQGVVLVVALLLLLVLTLIGLAATSGSTLEEKMASNHQDHQAAFQAAEAALADGEHQLTAGTICSAFDNAGCFAPPSPASVGATTLWKSIDWTDDDSFAYSGSLGGSLPTPRYFVQQLPPEPAPGQNLGLSEYGNVPPLQFLQVTAEGTSTDEPGEVILQSGFRP
ncbi:MAG TPA: PilX N-terminal domain-containing pilus assembly protein [Gammaproteobacteria bacterium]|nr:PilX N-terminal domain-containing pilus assembly protein [Gammaproteobacteria bacterium]